MKAVPGRRRDKDSQPVAWYVLADMDKDCEMVASRLLDQ